MLFKKLLSMNYQHMELEEPPEDTEQQPMREFGQAFGVRTQV